MSNKEMTTEKRLKVRLYLSLLAYTVVGYGLTLILDYIFSKLCVNLFTFHDISCSLYSKPQKTTCRICEYISNIRTSDC